MVSLNMIRSNIKQGIYARKESKDYILSDMLKVQEENSRRSSSGQRPADLDGRAQCVEPPLLRRCCRVGRALPECQEREELDALVLIGPISLAPLRRPCNISGGRASWPPPPEHARRKREDDQRRKREGGGYCG
jgi:hypothetical protein